jgi:hypothetical protein
MRAGRRRRSGRADTLTLGWAVVTLVAVLLSRADAARANEPPLAAPALATLGAWPRMSTD